MNIDIRENDRVFITGMTGSGKTHFAKYLLLTVPRLVVFDIKNNLKDEMDLQPNTKSNWRRFMIGKPIRLQITAPLGVNEQDYYHNLFKRVFLIGDAIVYIDELLGVVKNSVDLPYWLKAIYTRGREPIMRRDRIVGGNIGVVAATQRPAHIPVFCMTESEHFFVFSLQNPDDRKKVAAYTVPEIAEPIADEHGFYYYSNRTRRAEYVPKL